LGTSEKITLIENHTVTAGKFSKSPASSLFFEENQALNYAEGRASFRSGEIRIIDSTGEVERTIPNSPKRIEVVTADGAERFSGLPRGDFFTYRSCRISRSYSRSA
jgi:hypothetical protein